MEAERCSSESVTVLVVLIIVACPARSSIKTFAATNRFAWVELNFKRLDHLLLSVRMPSMPGARSSDLNTWQPLPDNLPRLSVPN